jgi:hypothetical protein
MRPVVEARVALVVTMLAVMANGSRVSSGSVQSDVKLRIVDVMTADEQQATGIAGLTPMQHAAFERWLTTFTVQVLKVAKSSTSPSRQTPVPLAATAEYAMVGSGHWIESVSSNGAIVTLEDGSMWEINSIDQIYTSIWLPITDITVLVSRSPIGPYQYVLVNKDDGEQALAKYLGK